MNKLFLLLLFPAISHAQDITGKWCAEYTSANNDGVFTECLIIINNNNSLQALQWRMAQCFRCGTPERVDDLPVSIQGQDADKLLSALNLKYVKGKLVDENGGPTEEDIEYERDNTYILKPSFNCTKAHQPREQAICNNPRLSLLDLELSLTFDAAKECKPKAKLDSAQNT